MRRTFCHAQVGPDNQNKLTLFFEVVKAGYVLLMIVVVVYLLLIIRIVRVIYLRFLIDGTGAGCSEYPDGGCLSKEVASEASQERRSKGHSP